MKKIRLGIALIFLSWLPFAQVFLWIAHNNGKLTSNESSDKFRLVIWGIQILIGFVGLWLVGKVAVQIAKKDGWRKTPSNLWQIFRHGMSVTPSGESKQA